MRDVLEQLMLMQTPLEFRTVIATLLVALVLALVVYVTYKSTYSGVVYNPRFNVSLVVITLVTTIIIAAIGNNIALSLGMVGALSIVRFRTAIKDPRDTAFIFWCIVIGLACGTQSFDLALLGSGFICLVLFAFKGVSYINNRYVLIVRGENLDATDVEKVLDNSLKNYVCKGKYVTKTNSEFIYDINIKKDQSNETVSKLHKVKGVKAVNIVQNNTETMG